MNCKLSILPLQYPPTDTQLCEVLAVYQSSNDFLALGPNLASMEMVLADIEHSHAEGGIFCGIYDDASGAMIGVLDYMLSGFEGDPRQAFLSLLMIAAPWRGGGRGAAVVAWFEAEVRRAGMADRILSGVQVNNPHAQRFWQRQGYQITGVAQAFDDGTVAYPLRKALG